MADQDMFGVKQTFGIFAPIMGLKKDFPVVLIQNVFTPDNKNILLKDGKIIRRKMREKDLLTAEEAKVQTPDGNPIIHYHRFVKRSTGAEYLLAFTKAHIYHWNSSNKAFDLKWTNHNITASTIAFNDNGASPDTITDTGNGFVTAGFVVGDKITITGDSDNNGDYTIAEVVGGTLTLIATDELTTEGLGDSVTIVANCENWEIANYNNKVIATNFLDKVLVWDTTGNFAALDTTNGIEYETTTYLTKAKHLAVYENYLILGYTYENDNYYPQRMRWNDIGNEAEWIAGTSGSTEVGKSDFITGFGKYQGLLIVFKDYSYYKYWLVATSLIFNGTFISMKIGCQCSGSIVNDNKGRLYWYASDGTFKEFAVGTISGPIQTDIVDKIYNTSVDFIKSAFIDETEEVCWSIPFDNALNNKLITFKEGKWLNLDLAIPAFGSYKEA